MTGSCEHDYVPSGSVKYARILEQLSVLASAPWSYDDDDIIMD
jgi:hypothetical protein